MSDKSSRQLTAIIAIAIVAAAVRLVPLLYLHPLNWDEIEFYRATDWVARGLVPFRDFWEHHTPLQWFVFAPAAALVKSPGVSAVVALRVAQIPLWIGVFALMLTWMRRAGLSAFARWSSAALALSSSLLMTPAVEYRIDTLGCFFYAAGLLLVLARENEDEPTRMRYFLAGVAFCLAGFSNLRLGPLLAITVLLLRIVDPREKRWQGRATVNWIFAGVMAAFAVCLSYFVATRSVTLLYRHVWYENWVGDRNAEEVVGGFVHRLLVPFGIRIIGSDRLFDLAGIDVGGAIVLVLGLIGLAVVLKRWRQPDDLFVIGFLQAASLTFIAAMKFIYNYHFEIVVVMMLPLVALTIERIPRRAVVVTLAALACAGSMFFSLFRGKELDRAYQDLIMRETQARTAADAKVLAGIAWGLRREPAYRLWFLPDLARQLVAEGHAPRYGATDFLADPPGIVVADHNLLVWMARDRQLASVIGRHYVPLWRNLWVPGLSGVLAPGRPSATWVVPATGDYRIFASREMAAHFWFRNPLFVGANDTPDAKRLELSLGAPAEHPALQFFISGRPVRAPGVLRLQRGQFVRVTLTRPEVLGVILLPGNDEVLFRQPPPLVTLDASASRVTHVPDFSPTIR